MNIKDLNRNLKISEIDFRVGSVIKSNKVWATILAYKDSRVDMSILDEVVGAENWQIKYREGKNSIVASIGVFFDDNKGWVWKENNGTPGDFEQEKGAYSDAMKRSGFMWGIGRSLYNFPKIFVELKEYEYTVNGNKATATSKLRPSDWNWEVEYAGQEVTKLIAVTKDGEPRFTYKR